MSQSRQIESEQISADVQSSVDSLPGSQKLEPGTPTPSAVESFMDSTKVLAPVYQGDEDLREFIGSAPSLGAILFRLVHYRDARPESSAASA